MAEIVVENLHKAFGDFVAVRDSSFTVRSGEFFMLLGPSGCGKTTTLRMIAGLELPTSGRITIDGQEVTDKPAAKRDIAFVFQMFALYPHMNVYQNIAYPLVSQGVPKAQIKQRIEEVTQMLEITPVLRKSVSGLSAGDRQRVALARAIVRRAKAFMMDEPLGALDAEFREHMAQELRRLHDRIKATTVYVTHDQLEAMQMGDKIAVMNNAVVEQLGTPGDIYRKPASLFVAQFIGSPAMNLLPFEGAVVRGDTQVNLVDHCFTVPRQHANHRGPMVLGVRPEHVRLSAEGGLPAEVRAVEYLGTSQMITLASDHGLLRARMDAHVPIKVGDRPGLAFVAETISLFDAHTTRALPSDLNRESETYGTG
ncbi:MAG: ABC transporter ATP-binding protein [Pseudomonadota bacterium]